MNQLPEEPTVISAEIMYRVRSAAEHHLVFDAHAVSAPIIRAIDSVLHEPVSDSNFQYQLSQEQIKLARYLLIYQSTTANPYLQMVIHEARVEEDATELVVQDWDLYFATESLVLQSMANTLKTVIRSDVTPDVFGPTSD